jgi:hypothetical protein
MLAVAATTGGRRASIDFGSRLSKRRALRGQSSRLKSWNAISQWAELGFFTPGLTILKLRASAKLRPPKISGSLASVSSP